MSISVIVHDPDPDPFAPVTADEIRELLECIGYHVQGVLIRQDFPPPYWLIWRGSGRHIGPFSSRLDACTALELTNAQWELFSDDEFHIYLDTRAVSK
jgi:hypothetical protein